MDSKKSKGIPLLIALLLLGAIPLIVGSGVLIMVASNSIKNSVQEETFNKLQVAAECVDQYFSYDIIANGTVDYEEYADHNFMECVKEEDVELTLFRDNVRFLTSLRNDDGTYNEGTNASDVVYNEVRQGKNYADDSVVINGKEYYVYYEPIYDGAGNFWGMAFAGTPEEYVTDAINSANAKLSGIVIATVIFFSAVIILIAVMMKRSFVSINDELGRLADGDLTKSEQTDNKITEINQMLMATDILQSKLLDVVGAVIEKTKQLSNSVEIVSSVANDSSQGTEQISNSMEELSKATISLTENVQDVSLQATSMGEHIQGITNNVETLSSASDEIKDATENAQNMVNKVFHSSEQSTLAVDEISESISLTNESIVKITEAVNLISEIAAQTNLLSLNASIEAARAGEAGRGFAVVAEEIGKLATESANTADSIGTLANDMTSKSTKTVELAEKMKTIIQEEQECVESTQASFESLGASIEESLAMITEIDTKAKELSSLKDGILANITDLSAISEENAANNEEVTATIATIAEKVRGMSDQSNEMKELSVMLEQAVSYFK